MPHQRHVVKRLNGTFEISLSGQLGQLQFLMLHEVVRPTSHVALVKCVKCVKCENSSLEIAQQIAAAWPFPHDIPKISKSEVLSSKMATETKQHGMP